jgi:hypothetical protein
LPWALLKNSCRIPLCRSLDPFPSEHGSEANGNKLAVITGRATDPLLDRSSAPPNVAGSASTDHEMAPEPAPFLASCRTAPAGIRRTPPTPLLSKSLTRLPGRQSVRQPLESVHLPSSSCGGGTRPWRISCSPNSVVARSWRLSRWAATTWPAHPVSPARVEPVTCRTCRQLSAPGPSRSSHRAPPWMWAGRCS